MLEQRGVIVRGDAAGSTWMLRHEVLTQRVRELTAPARAAARRAFELLGSKTATRGRLTLHELRALRREGIAPMTPGEVSIVERSKRHYMLIAGGIAAVPIVIPIAMIVSMRGHVFFDLESRAGGDHVLVRGGRAGLSAFGWLPGSGYGRVIADTGLTRAMVAPEVWKKIDARDIGADRGDWDGELKSMMAPRLAGLVDYATTGSDATLADALRKSVKDNPEDLAELLAALRPIARGTPGEVQLIEAALAMPSPAVQRAAVAAAGAAAQRHDVYQDTLLHALTSPDPELRRIAFSAVRTLGERGHALFQSALARDPEASARRELLVELSTATTDDTPSAASAVSVLADPDASAPLRDKAKLQIKGGVRYRRRGDGTRAAGRAGSRARGGADLRDRAAPRSRSDAESRLGSSMRRARRSTRGRRIFSAAALPLYAKVDPERAGGDLSTMLEDKKLDKPLPDRRGARRGARSPRRITARRSTRSIAMKDEDPDIRAAAATASGKLGRTYQDRLIKMAKSENYNVRIGAAEGLAVTAVSGGSGPVAVDGIAQLWREKGRPRRDAVKIWAHLARKKPFPNVVEYLATAAKSPEDPALHPVGVDGLCNAALAGSADARARAQEIDRRSIRRGSPDRHVVRRRWSRNPRRTARAIAAKLVRDPDNEIRADAARVLALTVGKGKAPQGVGDALVAIARRSRSRRPADRDPRGRRARRRRAEAGARDAGEDVRARGRGREARPAARGEARRRRGSRRARSRG